MPMHKQRGVRRTTADGRRHTPGKNGTRYGTSTWQTHISAKEKRKRLRNNQQPERKEMFRYKKGIPIPYNEQGYIYFLCRNYKRLPSEMQGLIRDQAQAAAGEYSKALLEFITSDCGGTAICTRHHISESTLERVVKRFYISFSHTL